MSGFRHGDLRAERRSGGRFWWNWSIGPDAMAACRNQKQEMQASRVMQNKSDAISAVGSCGGQWKRGRWSDGVPCDHPVRLRGKCPGQNGGRRVEDAIADLCGHCAGDFFISGWLFSLE